jgi:hypothetical protein
LSFNAAPPSTPNVRRFAASLKSALGGGLTVSARADKMADLFSSANAKATAALNEAKSNFPSGRAEFPASMAAFLERAAADLKQLPAGSAL